MEKCIAKITGRTLNHTFQHLVSLNLVATVLIIDHKVVTSSRRFLVSVQDIGNESQLHILRKLFLVVDHAGTMDHVFVTLAVHGAIG